MTGRKLLEARGLATRRVPCWRPAAARSSFVPILAVLLLTDLAASAPIQTKPVSEGLVLSFRSADLFAVQARCGSADPVQESYQLTRKHAYGGPEFTAKDIAAFEENRFFLYAVGVATHADAAGGAGSPATKSPRIVRRFILLKPSTFVIDDQVRRAAGQSPIQWQLHAPEMPQIKGRQVRISAPAGALVCESLLPEKAALASTRPPGDGKQAAEYRVEVVPEGNPDEIRFLHVLQTRRGGDESSEARSELAQQNGRLQLTVFAAGGVFRLFLGPGGAGTDEIEVIAADGQVMLPRRLLPAGVLPYGPEGTRLLERWDSAYRGDSRPAWDTGRPSSDLKKAVEEGTLQPCRVVELGCGTGTNAIYLASKGFDVTAIDIAPTALSRAEQKARREGVKVRWLLADVLAPPDLEPFELIYDRGCYHGVRQQNAAGYIRAVGRFSRPGGRLLLLAGNANEPGQGGPPRVKEEQLRGDFSESFEFEWLRETRFDTLDAEEKGALAWSALLRRKKEP